MSATASILTGLHPQEHGVLNATSCYLEQDIVTVAEALQLQGISTAAWTGNPLLSVSRNFDQGFEVFRGSRHEFRKTGVFFDEIAAWLEERAGQRFFLYLQLTEPHHPFVPLPEARAALAPDAPADFHERMMEVKAELRTGSGVDENGELQLDAIVSAQERRWASDVYDACVASGDHWLGRLVEEAPSSALYETPLHPYTQALLASTPSLDPGQPTPPAVSGEPPSPTRPPAGCPFHPRCPVAVAECASLEPEWVEVRPRHRVACHLVKE